MHRRRRGSIFRGSAILSRWSPSEIDRVNCIYFSRPVELLICSLRTKLEWKIRGGLTLQQLNIKKAWSLRHACSFQHNSWTRATQLQPQGGASSHPPWVARPSVGAHL